MRRAVGRHTEPRIFRALLLISAAVLVAGAVALPTVSWAQTATNVQEGDNRGRGRQRGNAGTGDAISGQVVGVVSSGRTSVDATNRSENASAVSGDADGSNSARSVVGNLVVGIGCRDNVTPGDVSTAQRDGSCPDGSTTQDILFDGSTVNAAVVHEGDNRQTIGQSANAVSGDAIAGGQVIGVVSAGDTSIVAANDARDVDARSGDADANNSLPDAEAGDLATFAPCCQLPPEELPELITTDIIAGEINAVIVHEGDNSQSLSQSANAATGDALAGAQVIGAVTGAGGRSSVDARNTARDASAESGEATADNGILFAPVGDAGVDVPICCGEPAPPPEPRTTDIIAGEINAVIVHEGDNGQSLGQSASATTGDALAGSQVIGSVSSGDSSIVAANSAENTDAKSGDARATNSILDAEAGDLVTFAQLCCILPTGDEPLLPADIVIAGALTGVIFHEGDNSQSIGQTAHATTGDALSGAQVIGAVTSGGGRTSVDARNTARNTSAESGDARADNTVPFAIAGENVIGFPVGQETEFPFEPGDTFPVIVHEGDNASSFSQTADASSGDALSGAQVIGVVSAGAVSVVVANDGENTDATTGDSRFDNNIDNRTGLFVEFAPGLPPVSDATVVDGFVGLPAL